jgi:hypothetical protein
MRERPGAIYPWEEDVAVQQLFSFKANGFDWN